MPFKRLSHDATCLAVFTSISNKPLTVDELSQAINKPVTVVSRNVQKLRGAGLIESASQVKQRTRYELTETGREALQDLRFRLLARSISNRLKDGN